MEQLPRGFRNRKVLIMGLGISGGGVGAARYFAKRGAVVTVTDLKSEDELARSVKELSGLPITFHLGGHKKEDFKKEDLVVRNPAVPPTSEFLKIARDASVPIFMESSLFFALSPTKKIIGVTGTKGKSTTTSLILGGLKALGKQAVAGGNLGISMFDILPKVKKDTWVVLELSSFQIEDMAEKKISPHIAVITNIFRDHLDRYKGFQSYIKAKRGIFESQRKDDFLILNFDNPWARGFARDAVSDVYFFSTKDMFVWSPKDTFKKKLPGGLWTGAKLSGRHNKENLNAALTCLFAVGMPSEKTESVRKTLADCAGVAERQQFVAQVEGVRFFDDTTATIPEATIAAIEKFSGNLILICGGKDKNLSYRQLALSINAKVKKVVVIAGTATEKLKPYIRKDLMAGEYESMSEAVERAYQVAEGGDAVILSPAAASFGLFQNEFDRGRQFVESVKKLKR